MAGKTGGIDWAAEAHEVCISEEGEVVERFSAGHDERGIAALTARLVRSGVERVAIERPDGILVERLLAAGLEVLAIHPNQVKAARPRFAVAHGKSDRFDAYVLAELARTDAHRFRALVPDSEETKALKALTRSGCGWSWQTSCAPRSRVSGPAGSSSARSTRRSRSPSFGATRARRTPRASARAGWPLSFGATPIAAAPWPPSWWQG